MTLAARPLPVWRSLLYVPAHVDRFVAKAHMRGADCVQLDLEDSVPPTEKERARAAVERAASLVRRGGADVVVRINRPLSLAIRDIESAIGPDVDGLSVTKVQSADHLRLLDEQVSEVERRRGLSVGRTVFIALVETAAAWPHLAEIARASPRVVALNMGAEDFALDCGIEPTTETLLLPKQQLVHAASAAGVLPLGLIDSLADFSDLARFRVIAQRSRQFGFTGASCIHPAQVPVLNETFAPNEEELNAARRTVAALEGAERDGRGAVELDGRMVDAPIAARARRVIERHAAIQARTARGALR